VKNLYLIVVVTAVLFGCHTPKKASTVTFHGYSLNIPGGVQHEYDGKDTLMIFPEDDRWRIDFSPIAEDVLRTEAERHRSAEVAMRLDKGAVSMTVPPEVRKQGQYYEVYYQCKTVEQGIPVTMEEHIFAHETSGVISVSLRSRATDDDRRIIDSILASMRYQPSQ
jgi:hypothetical protein